MLEQLTMQEVSQVILSVPEGAIIPGPTKYFKGEPVMIINRPGLSNLNFVTRPVKSEDGRGYISHASLTNKLDFIVNEGSVLYGLWSYLYGIVENKEVRLLNNVEYLEPNDGKLYLSMLPKSLFLYKVEENENLMVNPELYEVKFDEQKDLYYIDYEELDEAANYLASYTYELIPDYTTTLKQIHNNIFCALDIYISAVDQKTDDKYLVYIHCDKVQVDTDLIISVNNSQKASFTPIHICSIAQQDEEGSVNKDVATIMVIKNG